MKKTYNDCFSGFSYENPHVISYRNKRRGELVGKVIVLMLIIGVISVTSLARYASPLLGIPVFLVLAGLLLSRGGCLTDGLPGESFQLLTNTVGNR